MGCVEADCVGTVLQPTSKSAPNSEIRSLSITHSREAESQVENSWPIILGQLGQAGGVLEREKIYKKGRLVGRPVYTKIELTSFAELCFERFKFFFTRHIDLSLLFRI